MENSNWPDKVRLHMIEKSKFYPDDERIYQYGFYDGYHYALQNTPKIEAEGKELPSDEEIEKYAELNSGSNYVKNHFTKHYDNRKLGILIGAKWMRSFLENNK